jgi:ABC-2 type transport system ATP-binding protein
MKVLKKLLIILMAVTVISALFVINASAADLVYGAGTVNCTDLNVRSEANTKSSVIITLSRGDIVVILEKTSSDWYKINFKGTEGYVSTQFLTNVLTAENFTATGAVTGSDVNMRSTHSTSGKSLGAYSNGTVMTVIGINEGWYKVKYQSRIGYVPEEPNLYPQLSGREYLQLTGRIRGIQRAELERKIENLLRPLGIWEDRDVSLASYSKGMRQKILVSAALLHNPELLILDEPFSGLDTTTALVLRSLLRRLASRGKMILYSSHVLETVEKVCDTVLILRKGQVVAHDSVQRLREMMAEPSLEGVFTQLAQVQDTDAVAERIMEAVAL